MPTLELSKVSLTDEVEIENNKKYDLKKFGFLSTKILTATAR